ncbi:MAG: hypothetical protein ACOYMN_02710 [Roseimicrobium sp.]
MNKITQIFVCLLLLAAYGAATRLQAEPLPNLTLAREANWLIIRGPHLPQGEVRINYLEAYCRAGSTDRDWKETVVGHKTELLNSSPDGKTLSLRCTVNDGLVVTHVITAGADEVTFDLTVVNPTDHLNEAQWAQPCVRLGDFAGPQQQDPRCVDLKFERCFIFLDGKLARLPTTPWAITARYVPGQVWCPKHVPRSDVNPRPLSVLVPSSGLIGCFSADDQWVFAMAFEPYQELFQGVARCLHSDFRIGVLAPGMTKKIHGKIYLMKNDIPALVARYTREFLDGH